MAVSYGCLKYVLAGLAVVVLVYLEILASVNTGVEQQRPGQLLVLMEEDATSVPEETSYSTDASTAKVTDDPTTTPTTTTTTEAPSPTVAVDKNSMRYLHQPGFVIENAGLCRGNGSRLRVLILITSAPDHQRHRMAIRYTWGHFGARSDVAIGFLLGAVEEDSVQRAVQQESDTYSDIVQSRNVDGYRRLSLKTLSLLEWVDAHCPAARFVLKTDDDMFINVPELLRFVKDHEGERNALFGLLAQGWRPIRSPDSKYRVSMDEFPPKVLPDFTTGPAYLLTGDVVGPMLASALDRRFLPLEDVLFTGVVAGALGVRKVHSPKFHPRFGSSHKDDCRRQISISAHDVAYAKQFLYWSKLLDGTLKC